MDGQQRRGVVLILAALLVPVLIGFAALAVDTGFLWTERSALQNTADAAALACASALPGDVRTASLRGLEFIRQNPTYGPIDDSQIIPGVWTQGRFLPRSDNSADSCRVMVGRNDDLFFARIFNTTSARVVAQATASRYPGDANISLVLDNSGSIFFDIGTLRNAAIDFLRRLDSSAGNHAVSLTTFSSDASNRIPLTQNLQDVENQLRRMTPDGWTNIGAGVFHGRQDAWEGPGASPIPMDKARNIMVVLSDGATNRGRGGEPGQDCYVSPDEIPDTRIEEASRKIALCEADQFKDGDPGDRPVNDPDGNMLITISLGWDTDLQLMSEMSSDDACRETTGGIQKGCAANEPKCCHYRAPSRDNLKAIFDEILYNGPVALVD